MLDTMDDHTKLIHYTNGGPWFPQYADHPHAGVWHSMRDEMYQAQPSAVRVPHFPRVAAPIAPLNIPR